MNNNISDFSLKSRLNPKIWREDDSLQPTIRAVLLHIAEEFMSFVALKGAEIQDVRFTGSLANFRYHPSSDIDLHLVIDFDKVSQKKDLVRQMFSAKAALWNIKHDIKLRGYDVEIYVEDISEPHYSTGVYSIMHKQWLSFPVSKSIDVDLGALRKKVERYASKVVRLSKRKHTTYGQVKRLVDKIKDMRKTGLEKEGESSIENLTFKVLRRSGYIETLFRLRDTLYDKKLSRR
tara:strand:+ start:7935 stop:8636 length:702 start_codon:yes stop_codon:yes gene_type:complete